MQAILDNTRSAEPGDPFAGAHLAIANALGEERDAAELLEYWRSRAPGNPRGDMRYRWELSHRRGVRMPVYAENESEWVAWRAAERPLLERDAFEFEQRLATPVVLAENAELLAQVAEGGSELAHDLLAEAAPVLRRDFAGFVQALDPWQDTFALWCLTRRLRALSLLHPLAVAIATCYAAAPGPVMGSRFPFHRIPLVSASAQLASSLLSLGLDLDLVADLVDFVAKERLPSGGWGDASDEADVLTTLVAADLMVRIDPSFDFVPTQKLLERMQGRDDLWRAIGPEAPWLSAEVVTLLLAARQPFALRFRWPYLPPANRDHKTKLPFYAYFAELGRLFAALPGLRSASVELGFIDLVGFRAFNNAYGQERGDEVLRAFAQELEGIDAVRAIRDGGDEFILVASPERRGLKNALDGFRRDWPNRFRDHFGADVPPVAPRILVGRTQGDGLIGAREELGRRITTLKHAETGPEGVMVDAGELG